VTKKSTCPSSTVIGYLRVSTADQNIEKNKADILQLANGHDLGRVRFVEEKISGKVSWRKRKVAEVLESLRANDAIVVSELSRLGRSMLECMEILSVAAQKRINVYAVKGAWRLDQSIRSKIIAMAFSMAAEIERDLISLRTKEALRFKKAQGMKLGRTDRTGEKQTRSVSS
jgi:DNA invertase Pin-like site-specific DNA recombinase